MMADVAVEDLLDDINTDAMTPAWVCFNHRPEDLAREAYAGLIVDGERLFERDALIEAVSRSSSRAIARESAARARPRCRPRSGVASDRHRGVVRPDPRRQQHQPGRPDGRSRDAARAAGGEGVPLEEFYRDYDPITQLVVQHGGLFPSPRRSRRRESSCPLPRRAAPDDHGREDPGPARRGRSGVRQAGRLLVVRVDGGYYARVHHGPGALLPAAGVRRRLPHRDPSASRSSRTT